MKTKLLTVVMLFCVLGLVAQAEVSITTADGNGADTYLANDSQGGQGPDAVLSGETRIRAFRAFDGVRMKIGYIRFDLASVDGDLSNAIVTMDLLYMKGGVKTASVYGLLDGPGDYWDESTISYNTAPGFIPNPPTELGFYDLIEEDVVYLGTIDVPAVPDDPADYPITFSSEVATLDMSDYLNTDTNGLVTLIFIGSDNEGEVASKERTADPGDAPMLTFPDANDIVARAYDPVPGPYDSVSATGTTQVSWTNPEPNNPGETVTCDVYFGTSEPNALLPNWGLTLLESDVADGNADLPALSPYTTYYWAVNVKDSSFPSRIVPGYVWVFDTNNQAPVVDAGADQYVWLTKAVVNTGSSNDTYMRDNTDRGGMEFMDIRGGGVDFGGYLQFNLSEISALGPGTLENATLILQKVAASRNDTIVNGRFSLHGLNDVAGNTPQNWDEHLLNTDTVGDEWGAVPLDLSGGRLTDLDDDVAGISEVIANDVVTVSGAALDAFLQARVDDNGLVTFVITCEDSNDRGYGIATKENSTEAYRPVLSLTYVPDSASNNGDAEVLLDGTVVDDGLPNPPAAYTVLWTQVSGPETVSIDPNNVEDVTVYIGTSGFYEFQLEANDSDLSGSDTVQIYVGVDSCDAAQNVPGYEAILPDFNSDCIVDLKDYATFAAAWLECNSLECLAP